MVFSRYTKLLLFDPERAIRSSIVVVMVVFVVVSLTLSAGSIEERKFVSLDVYY